MWLAILASVGVGAATFYTMSKSNAPLSNSLKNITPMLSNMTNQNSSNTDSGSLGQNGMS